jgi:hypothetical protein
MELYNFLRYDAVQSDQQCHVYERLCTGFGLLIGNVHEQNVTANSYSYVANSRALQFATARTNSSQSTVFSSVVAWRWISTMFLPTDDWPTADSLLQLPDSQGGGNLTPISHSSLCSLKVKSQSYVTTYGQSASLTWCPAPIWGPKPDICYCQRVTGLLTRGRVCCLQFSPPQLFWSPSPAGLMTIFYCLKF